MKSWSWLPPRRHRPDWFEDTAQTKKYQLIEMAKNGEKRPTKKNCSLGGALVNYTYTKSCSYDPIFDQYIRELRPDWFKDKAQTIKPTEGKITVQNNII